MVCEFPPVQDLTHSQTTVLHLGVSEKGRTHAEVPVDCLTTRRPLRCAVKRGDRLGSGL